MKNVTRPKWRCLQAVGKQRAALLNARRTRLGIACAHMHLWAAAASGWGRDSLKDAGDRVDVGSGLGMGGMVWG